MKQYLWALAFLSLTTACNSQKKSMINLPQNTEVSNNRSKKADLNMFPPAKKGFKQFYIQMPPVDHEADYKVEVFVGLEKEVDCNHHFLGGQLEEKNLEGWGYTYYESDANGAAIGSTMMGCPDTKTLKFIHQPSVLLRYNSRLPIVIYVPNDMEVRYRIWNADETLLKAQK